MAVKKVIKYTIHEDFNKVFDEKGNTFLAMRKISWGDSEKVNLDIRKWYTNAEGEETVGKGLSFLTEEGPDQLADMLLDIGYGNTEQCLRHLSDREDFKQSLNKVVGKESGLYDDTVKDDYYDPMELIS